VDAHVVTQRHQLLQPLRAIAVIRPQHAVHLVVLLDERPRNVKTDEAGRAREEHALHRIR
jgi:hypothetical protein